MTWHIPDAPKLNLQKRQERLATDVPQAASAINTIENSTKPLKYGEKRSRVLRNYHFVPQQSVRAYFEAYLGQNSELPPDETRIKSYVAKTINMDVCELTDFDENSEANFKSVFDDICGDIELSNTELSPMLRFVVGPTGSGKTIFSKSLFTVCLGDFWKRKIVPSRIEYSKIEKKLDDKKVNELEFFSHIRKCMFRDLVHCVFLSGNWDHNEIENAISSNALPFVDDHEWVLALQKFNNLRIKFDVNAEGFSLDKRTRLAFENVWQVLSEAQIDHLLYTWSERFGLSYLVSFDGFDCVKIDDFLFGNGGPLPIRYLSELLHGLQQNGNDRKLFRNEISVHFMVYVRDTTYDRLSIDCFQGVREKIPFPTIWIVPPRYDMLVENVASILTGQVGRSQNSSKKFCTEMYRAFNASVLRGTALRAEIHMNFVFGSNARKMYQHIKQNLFGALLRAVNSRKIEFDKSGSGSSPKDVWEMLVENFGPSNIPHYRITEDLFLGETRQLMPRFRLNPTDITRILVSGNLEEAIRATHDVDESSGIFGCILNYFSHFKVVRQEDSLPAFLLLVRILQFIFRNRFCNSREVHAFVIELGYDCNVTCVEYCIYILLRAELVKWQSNTAATSISDVTLFVTVKGEIAVSRLLCSITYLSESFLTCAHFDRTLSDLLVRRNFDNSIWVADCVFNASIAIELVRKCEALESENFREKGKDFSNYYLEPQVRRDLEHESKAIVNSITQKTNARWRELKTRQDGVRRILPQFVLLGVTI
jgi:hypothetical protein